MRYAFPEIHSLAFILLLSISVVQASVLHNRGPRSSLFIRQSLPSINNTAAAVCVPCNSSCTSYENYVSGCTASGVACVCSNAYFQVFLACIDCVVGVDGLNNPSEEAQVESSAQQALNDAVSLCAQLGYDVGPYTISPSAPATTGATGTKTTSHVSSTPEASPTGHTNQFTSSNVNSCGNTNAISVSNFQIAYNRFTRSLNFSITATATQDDLYPVVNFDFTSLSKLPTQCANICQLSTCPLSTNVTTIQSSILLSQANASQIPSTFWTLPMNVPVKMTLVRNTSTSPLTCLMATLSNGLTTQHTAIPWTTGSIVVLLLLVGGGVGAVGGTNVATSGVPGGHSLPSSAPDPSSGVSHGVVGDHSMIQSTTMHTSSGAAPGPHTLAGHSGPPAARMDPITLFLHFQFISSTGLLSLNYPSVYHSFTANFAWANLILPIHAFRRAATHMRRCTVNASNPIPAAGPTVTSGISEYSSRLGINAQDVFGVVFLVFLSLCALLVVVFLLTSAVMQTMILRAKDEEKKGKWESRKGRFLHMASNNTFRLMLLGLGTLATFTFYQWTLPCTSDITFLFSALVLAFVLITLSSASFLIFHVSRRPDGTQRLYSKDHTYARRWGSMYDTLNEGQLYFSAVLWIAVLCRSAIVGIGQSSGLAQVVALIVLELSLCSGLFACQPYYSRGYNRVNYLIQGTKVFSNVLLLTFVDELHIDAVTTSIIGCVLLTINSIVALILVVLTVLKLGWGRLWYRRKHITFEKDLKPVEPQDLPNDRNGYDPYRDQ